MSTASRFDRADFTAQRHKVVAQPKATIQWPLPNGAILKLGESVVAHRKGSGRPHKGVDIFVAPNTPVLAAVEGRVLKVFDARRHADPDVRRAGLYVDILAGIVGWEGLFIFRYLHLWKTAVSTGAYVEMGAKIALTGTAKQVGIEHSGPHIHFEVRQAKEERGRFSYGVPIDPLELLPPLQTGDLNA